jgi:hypothetical protein
MNQASITRQAILVIGMHRSGTSAVTRGLEVLGVNLGTRLRSPRTENPKGFWEDLDFNAINTDVLQSFGLEWHTPGRIDPIALRSSRLLPLMDRATAFLDKKFAANGIIGLKDPRASRVLPFWEKVFERSEVAASYVIACRNPLSVAKSLAARDGFPFIKGHVLWLEYMLCSLTYSASRPRIVIDYDNMLEQPGKELTRIAAALDLTFEINGSQFQEYNTKFLSTSLRSTNYKIQDLIDCDNIPSISKDMYSLINNIACDRKKISDSSTHDEILIFDTLFSKNINFFQSIIDEFYRFESASQKISILESQNFLLHEELKNSCKKNMFIYYYFKVKEKILLKFKSARINSIRAKMLRHLNSAFLIFSNTKSASTLRSLHHEIIGSLKNSLSRKDKKKQTHIHNASK